MRKELPARRDALGVSGRQGQTMVKVHIQSVNGIASGWRRGSEGRPRNYGSRYASPVT